MPDLIKGMKDWWGTEVHKLFPGPKAGLTVHPAEVGDMKLMDPEMRKTLEGMRGAVGAGGADSTAKKVNYTGGD